MHRFKGRYRGVAFTSVALGGALSVVSGIAGFIVLPLFSGLVGVMAGVGYLASPTWRLAVAVDDSGLTVGTVSGRSGEIKKERFKLAWSEVARVVASPSTKSCFVDGGEPARSLLVPGVGAPAPYDIVGREALFDAIIAHVPADKVQTVETLEKALAEANAKAAAEKAKATDAKPADKPS
jgi:hypothetical protein